MRSIIDAIFRYRVLFLIATFIVVTLALTASLSIYNAQRSLAKVDVQKIRTLMAINCHLHEIAYKKYESQGFTIVRYRGKDKPNNNATCAISKPLLYPFGHWQLNYNNELQWVNKLNY